MALQSPHARQGSWWLLALLNVSYDA